VRNRRKTFTFAISSSDELLSVEVKTRSMRWVILRFSSQFISALCSPYLTNNKLMTSQ